MPYQFLFEPQRNLIRESFHGVVTADELMRLSAEEWASAEYRKGLHVISDFRDARVNISFEQMVQYAAFVEQGQGIGRQAIVVGGNLEYGLARMFELLTDGRGPIWTSLKIFYDYAEAEAWVTSTSDSDTSTDVR